MKYGYLYIPGLIILLMPFVKAICDMHKANVKAKQKKAAKEQREAARREAIRKHNEEVQAAKEAEQAAKDAIPKRRPGRPRKSETPVNHSESNPPAEKPVDVPPEVPEVPEVPEAQPKTFTLCGNNAFVGQCVSFTGTLTGMTRDEAIKAVQSNGGKAFDSMPVSTTLLVVGNKPGARKLEKADEWPSCRKIPQEQFFIMLKQPATFEPDELAAFVRSRFANKNA